MTLYTCNVYCHCQITPIKSSELDAVLAENKKQISKMTLIDDDLEGETKDLFVTIDNPEKHTTTMESYITFRVTTKVRCISVYVCIKNFVR